MTEKRKKELNPPNFPGQIFLDKSKDVRYTFIVVTMVTTLIVQKGGVEL